MCQGALRRPPQITSRNYIRTGKVASCHLPFGNSTTAHKMAQSNRFCLYASAFLMITVLIVAVQSYNEDRNVYKWSPLWFNSYLRRGVLHKRFNDDMPIYKWSPLFFERSNPYRYFYKRGYNCLPEWAECRQDDAACCAGQCFEGFCIGASSLE